MDMHARVVGMNLHHHVLVSIHGLAGLAQVEIMPPSALKAGAMEIANTTAIANNAPVAHSARTAGNSSMMRAVVWAMAWAVAWAVASWASITALVNENHDASRNLVRRVYLDHGIRGRGTCLTLGTQVVVVADSALESEAPERALSALVTLNAIMSDSPKTGIGSLITSSSS